MAKKQSPVINITGVNQIATIKTAYASKKELEEKTTFYNTCRESLIQMVLPKIYKLWSQNREVLTGKIILNLADKGKSEEEIITVQNRQNSVNFEAGETAEVLRQLNENIPEDKQLFPKDVFKITTTRTINPVVMASPKVKERITAYLVSIEADLKAEGVLAPEVNLFVETKEIGLTDVAIPRLLTLSDDFDKAIKTLKEPIVISMVAKKEKKE